MSYKNLTPKQIYTGEANYTLEDFAKNFRKQAEKDWGSDLLDKKNKNSKTLYQGIFILIVLTSQDKPPKLINELLFGEDTREMQEAVKEITDMYGQEIKILLALQMKMFLDNLREYGLPDSLNLKLLNADFRIWFKNALNCQN